MLAGEYLPESGLTGMRSDVEFQWRNLRLETIVLMVDGNGRESDIEECLGQSCATGEDLYYKRLTDTVRQDAVSETCSAEGTV